MTYSGQDSSSGLDAIDSEIALTALLATTITTFGVGMNGGYSVMKLVAVLLLLITFLRRLLIIHSDDITLRSMLVLNGVLYTTTSLAVGYIAYAFSVWLLPRVPVTHPMVLFSITLIFVIAGVIRATGDVLLYYELVFDLLRRIRRDRRAAESAYDRLTQLTPDNVSQSKSGSSVSFVVAIFISVGIIVENKLLGDIILPSLLSIVLLFALQGIIVTWYTEYGVIDYDQIFASFSAIGITVLGFFFTVVFYFLIIYNVGAIQI